MCLHMGRYVPLRLGEWFRAKGIDNVRELDWWQRVQHPGSNVSIVMTPAQACGCHEPSMTECPCPHRHACLCCKSQCLKNAMGPER